MVILHTQDTYHMWLNLNMNLL